MKRRSRKLLLFLNYYRNKCINCKNNLVKSSEFMYYVVE